MTFKDLVLNRKLKGPGTCKTTRTGMINREKEKGWAGGHIKNESKIHNSRILEKNNIKNKQQKYTDKNLIICGTRCGKGVSVIPPKKEGEK